MGKLYPVEQVEAREAIARIKAAISFEIGMADPGTDTSDWIAEVRIADLQAIMALPPVKQSDGLAERVKEACAVVADDDAAQAPQANGAKQGSVAASYHAGWEHAGRRIASAIRSLDITRMDSDG